MGATGISPPTKQSVDGISCPSVECGTWNSGAVDIKHQLQVHKINISAQTIHMCTKRKINEEFITINHLHTSLKNPLKATSEERP